VGANSYTTSRDLTTAARRPRPGAPSQRTALFLSAPVNGPTGPAGSARLEGLIGIRLCPREARTSRNGPPSSTSSPAPPACGGGSRRGEPPGAGRRGASRLAALSGQRRAPSVLPTSRGELRQRHRYDFRISPQPRRHPPTQAEIPDRSSPTDACPATLARRYPLPLPRLVLPASPRVASTVHPLGSLTLTSLSLICPAPHSLAAAPPQAPSSFPPGLARPGLPGRSRKGGSGAKRRTPLPRKPRRDAKETPSRWAAACCAHGRNPLNETDGAKQMEGNRPGNHRRHDRADLGSRFPRAICPAAGFTRSGSQT
jgi:hypothetical protein